MLNSFAYYLLLLAVVGVPFYFQQRLENWKQERALDQNSLPEINKLSAKLSAFVLGSLYLLSFLSFQIRNSAYSKIGFAACIFSYFFLYSFRNKVIQEIREIKATPEERFQRSFRTFAAMCLLYGIYFTVVRLMIPTTGTLPALVVAMIFITYASPLFVRVWMPSHKMHDSSLKEEILKMFQGAGNPVKQVFLIDTDQFKAYNAMVCGPKYGFGPFQRSVFITKNLFEVLEMEEIRAVMAHEAAHFKLNHISKRGMMSLLGVGLAILAVGVPIACAFILFHISDKNQFPMMMLSSIVTIMFQFSFIYRVIRKQEFEADLEALNLGATVATLSSALEKITDKNGGNRKREDWLSRFMSGHAHPSLEERVAALQAGAMPESSKILPPWTVTGSYASFVIALIALTAMDPFKTNTDRTVASATEGTAGQNLPTPENTIKRDPANSEE